MTLANRRLVRFTAMDLQVMKRGTPNHIKTRRLMLRLGIDLAKAVGTLELLWHTAAQFSRRGNIGEKLSDDEIASYVGWAGEAKVLIDGLVECKWLDVSEGHRLIVHDWQDHCDDYTKKTVKRYCEEFCVNGKSVWKIPDKSQTFPELVQKKTACLAMPSHAQPQPADAAVVLVELEKRGLSKSRSLHFAQVFSLADATEILAFFDSEVSAGRLKVPQAALKTMLESPEKWDFVRDGDGVLRRPPDGACSRGSSSKPKNPKDHSALVRALEQGKGA